MKPLPDRHSLPATLVERPQWVCWREEDRDGKRTKIPVNPHTGGFASTTDPETWSDFETAEEHAQAAALGLGFVFTEADPLVGIDLDKCHDAMTGTATEWAQDIIDRLDSYTEVSPSGTGFHVIVEGELPEGRNRRGDVEMYAQSRYFTVTGEHLRETPADVRERTAELGSVHREYVLEAPEAAAETPAQATLPSVELDDETLLSRARTAQNGEKFRRLWNGNTAGYASASEADMALCALLAFWSGGDATQMNRLFRESGLYREKWDEVHFADGSTYGEKTIERAIDGTSEFYTPGLGGDDRATTRDERAPSHPVERPSTPAISSTDWHAVVEELTQSISQLEAENRRLATELEQERATRRLLEAQLEDARGPASLWQRLTRRQEADSESRR